MLLTDSTNSQSESPINQGLLVKLYNKICIVSALYFIGYGLGKIIIGEQLLTSASIILIGISYFLIHLLIPCNNNAFSKGKSLFYIISFGAINMDFFLHNGIYGPVLFIIFPLSMIILFLSKNKYRYILLSILFINITILFTIQFLWPNSIQISHHKYHLLERNISFIFNLTFTIYLISNILHQYIEDKKKAFESETAKSEFLATMSHMIRTPLNIINGFANFLEDDSFSKEEKQDFIKRMNSNTKTLNKLINNLIDLSIIQEKTLLLHTIQFPLKRLLDHLSTEVKNELSNRNKKIDFLIHKDKELNEVFFNTDYDKLYQVFWNILDNAIKFTTIGTITIYIAFSHQHQMLLFQITDTGVGIKTQQQKHLFDLINKKQSSFKTEDTSPGLGLNISQGIIKYLGGKILVKSDDGFGTEVSILLPKKLII
ncbi:MAG: hypothetical protein GQ527_11800 [Bacteroidales bacterium]|nr:hypothetical protein [Bacteroidales bacterium]